MRPVAVAGWHGRRIAGWRLLGGMAAPGVAARMRDAIGAHGAPAMANSDRGSACDSAACGQLLEDARVPQGMDGEARRVDDVVVGRWSRSLRSECAKIEEREAPGELRGIIDEHVGKRNDRRLHESLDHGTPASWCYSGMAARLAA